jgi:hypothetical protein
MAAARHSAAARSNRFDARDRPLAAIGPLCRDVRFRRVAVIPIGAAGLRPARKRSFAAVPCPAGKIGTDASMRSPLERSANRPLPEMVWRIAQATGLQARLPF